MFSFRGKRSVFQGGSTVFKECNAFSIEPTIYLEPKWPLFLKVNPPKQGLFQSKQGSFGFQVHLNAGALKLRNSETVMIRGFQSIHRCHKWRKFRWVRMNFKRVAVVLPICMFFSNRMSSWFQLLTGKKCTEWHNIQKHFYRYALVNYDGRGKSLFSIGATSSFMVPSPASYVTLPECICTESS